MATAQQEILLRIRNLDADERDMRRQAERCRTDAACADAKAEALATLRRQYEFCLVQLGGEFPQASTAVQVPVRQGPGRLIGQLG